MQTLQTINFCGIKGEVIESSPHGNYLVVKLSKRVAIIGTFSNAFSWQESAENNSGFISFIAYVGLRKVTEKQPLVNIITELGGNLDEKAGIRKAKRVKDFPLEVKVRDLSPESVVKLTQLG